MGRSRRLVILLTLSSIVLGGCWDRTELNELSITSAAALDIAKNGQWVLSFQVILPSSISAAAGTSGGPSGQVPVVVYSTEGDTIKGAVSESYMEAPRKLYFGHNSILVIGEEAAKKGFSQMVDLYLRNSDSRETVSILIASGDGRSILEQLLSSEPIPGIGLERILEKQERYLSKIPNVRMYDLIKKMLSPSHSTLVPEVIISGSKEVTGIDQLKQTTVPSKLRLGRAAIIKETKLVGWMSDEEALGASFLSDQVRASTIPFASDPDKEDAKDSTFMVTSSKTRIKVQEADGKFNVNVKIEIEGWLNETGSSTNLLKPETIRKMEESVQNEVVGMCKRAWAASKKANADVAGISEWIHRRYPKQWKQMEQDQEDVFKKVNLQVNAEVKMKKVGLSNKGYNKLSKKEQEQ
ncbi:Ger(x)C family spore germination protein [Paenibacillus mesotrionivorans]|uniref:Ger(X)C family spore germination protein n=1 Tax=Paenibacillus mesotrionivorans TaxID=3160968 RepID=A0ACC7NUA4_9BACL